MIRGGEDDGVDFGAGAVEEFAATISDADALLRLISTTSGMVDGSGPVDL